MQPIRDADINIKITIFAGDLILCISASLKVLNNWLFLRVLKKALIDLFAMDAAALGRSNAKFNLSKS